MAWLTKGAHVLASLEVADRRGERRRGLLGRDGIEGALLIRPARSVHTLGMRFPIDVAFCDGDVTVLEVLTLPPGRVTRPRAGARMVIEAEAGSFAAWEVEVGDRLEIKE